MKCPACKTVDLVMSDRNGVEIDYCPQCRGIWLDRGELDKIIERSAEHYHGGDKHTKYFEKDHYYDHDKKHQYKKKKGFLGDLFDFD